VVTGVVLFRVSLIPNCNQSKYWWEKKLLKKVSAENVEQLIDFLDRNGIEYDSINCQANNENIDLNLSCSKQYCIWWNRELETYERRVNFEFNNYKFTSSGLIINNHDLFDMYPSLMVANFTANNRINAKQISIALLLEETGNISISYKLVDFFWKNFVDVFKKTKHTFTSEDIWLLIDKKMNQVQTKEV
jgi:hypothetical protein